MERKTDTEKLGISAFSSSSKLDTIIKILEKIKEKLIEYKNSNFLTKEISLKIYDNLMLSIQELQLTSNMNIMKLFNNIFQVLTTENNYTVQSQDNMIEMQRNYNNYVTNPIINTQIIPYFINNKNINLLTEKNFKDCIMSFNGYRNKETVYIVLKMILDFARDKGYIYFIPKLKKPKRPYTDKEERILFIESDRQDIWLDCFEKENTDISLLFETMLLTGLRP